ncbi:MAG: HAD-IC family P-type ATPase [Woeseiaceae bacterium]|nr:HAD-IC family P-type ATPase [Woeseiaceae bacterium]
MTIRIEKGFIAWSATVDAVLHQLEVDPEQGLGDDQAAARRAVFGRNQLRVTRKRHVISILKDQFTGIVTLLLVVACGLALAFSEVPEAVAILAVIVVNAAIGFFTEWRAIRSMEALKQFARFSCVVLRGGVVRRTAAENLVPGDIVFLEAGDVVPADLRLIEAVKLTTNESTLTGESLPVHKLTNALDEQAVMFERFNTAFKGTAVTRGTGRGVVTATGLNTEFGKIFEEVSEAHAVRTPLEKRLDVLGEWLAWAVIVIGVLLAAIGIMTGRDVQVAIQVAIALAVAAIPEGLPIVATIALARGMWRMAKRNALITKLSAVETLGATSVILTDKTGTLTENRMAVTTALLPDGEISLADAADPTSTRLLDEMLATAALCNGAALTRHDYRLQSAAGDPTEIALLEAAASRNIWREDLLAAKPELREDPFDPDKKRMATVHRSKDTCEFAIKGAPEVVLSYCVAERALDGDAALDRRKMQDWLGRIEHLCTRGLRTLAVATKTADAAEAEPYSDLVLLGVLGLEDPPRKGIGDVIDQCREAGVLVVMVTGDHAETAKNVAAVIGVTDASAAAEQFLGGESVVRMLEEDRDEELLAGRVFSRVTPEQKLKLIDLYQRHGHVVAMTGDGVNDAPALKKADIGVAMGIRGTAVAKEAAEMVLQDDDFGTIVLAIGHGRAIFQNIRKFVIYLLSCNTSEVLVVSLATLAGAPLPLLPLQILFLNLVTDVFPALALGVGPGRKSLMRRKPRLAHERILDRGHWIEIGIHGVILAAVTLCAMAIGMTKLGFSLEKAVTVAFCTIALAQLWHVFNMRGNMRSVVKNEITRNPWIWVALAVCLGLILAAVWTPLLSGVLRLVDPGAAGWLLILLFSLAPLAAAPLVRQVTDSLR